MSLAITRRGRHKLLRADGSEVSQHTDLKEAYERASGLPAGAYTLITADEVIVVSGPVPAPQPPPVPVPVPVPTPTPTPAVILRPFSVSVVQQILQSKRASRTVGKVASFGDSLTVTQAYRRAAAPLSPADLVTFDWMHGRETGDANGFTLAGGEAITARSGAGWGDSWIDAALANPRVTDSQFIDWLFNSVPTIDLVKARCDQTKALGAVPILWTVPPRVAPAMPDYDAVYTQPHNARVKAFCDANGLPCIDLYAAMVATPNWQTVLVSEDGVHLTLAGYDLRTTLLVEMIGELKRLAVDTLPEPTPAPPPVSDLGSLATLPLIQETPGPNALTLKRIGAFRVPDAFPPDRPHDTFFYAWQGMAHNPDRDSLFGFGHAHGAKLAEITIPALVDGPFDALNMATFLQPFTDPTNGGSAVALGDRESGGVLKVGNELLVSLYIRYDASGSQRKGHWRLPADLSRTAEAVGPCQVGDGAAGLYSGYMCHIPAEWQAVLGGDILTGLTVESIISRGSFGPCFAVLKSADLSPDRPAPATRLVASPDNHTELYGRWGVHNTDAWGSTAFIVGIAFVPGTRTILCFGTIGTGDHCYGYATTDQSLHQTPYPGLGQPGADARGFSPEGVRWCYAPPGGGGKSQHGWPYRWQVWAFDALTFVDVVRGLKNYWEIRPYAYWPIDIPFTAPTNGARGYGMTVDMATRRIYIAPSYTPAIGATCPVIHGYGLV